MTRQTKKLNMPKTAEEYYIRWTSYCPESFSSTDKELFYMFVSVLLRNSNIDRDRYWLKSILLRDCKKLNAAKIDYYCDIYEHLKNYHNVWEGHTAKLIAESKFEREREETKKKYEN